MFQIDNVKMLIYQKTKRGIFG